MEVCDWDARVFEDHTCPHLAEGGGDFGLEARQGGKDVIINGVLISSFHPDGLTGSQRFVTCVALLDRLLEKCRSICIDDDCCPRLEVIHSLPDLHWVIVEKGWIHGHETQMAPGLSRRYHFFGGLGDQWTNQRRDSRIWRLSTIEIHNEHVEGGQVLFHVEQYRPVHTHDQENEDAEY